MLFGEAPSSHVHVLYTNDTINVERFAGLNFCGFHPMKFFMENLLRCLTFKVLKQRHYNKLIHIHRKTFTVLLITAKNVKI